MPLWSVPQKILAFLERKAMHAHLHELRGRGNRIAHDLRFGPRVQITVAPGGRLTIAEGVEIVQDSWLVVDQGDEMRIDGRAFISQHCMISGSVTVGPDTLIAGYVTILDANHRFLRTDIPIRQQGGEKSPIRIGEDVWIGSSCVILPGVSIGSHAVIGANSTVTGDIPDWAVAVGSPARVIRSRKAV